MNYVQQLNAFLEASIGVLNPKEQAMYLRLFGIGNKLRWPEWFTVSNTQLMHELCVKSEHTIIAIRKSLTKKGFINTRNATRTAMTQYHLIQLQTTAKNAVAKTNTTAKNAVAESQTTAKNAVSSCKKCSSTTAKNADIINSKLNIKHNIYINTNPEEIHEEEKTIDQDVLAAYEKYIHLTPSPLDLDKLPIDIERYGKADVIAAIKEAGLRGKRSLGYAEAIMKNKAEEREENANGKGPVGKHRQPGTKVNAYGRKMRYDSEAEQRKWENEPQGWAE